MLGSKEQDDGHPDYPWSRTDVEQMMSGPGRAVFELVPNRVFGVMFPQPE